MKVIIKLNYFNKDNSLLLLRLNKPYLIHFHIYIGSLEILNY